MQTTLKNLEGLNKSLTISVPIADFNAKLDKVLNDLKGKVQIDGFRQGKVPISVIKQKYGANLKTDATNDIVGEVLPQALKDENINPAGQPTLTNVDFDNKETFSFTVEFEVFPEINVNDLSKLEISKTISKISKEDEGRTLDGLKEQMAEFKEVNRVSKNGDRIKIDFKGFVDGKEFAGGDAKDFALILGKSTMIPGFEEALIGKKTAEETKFEVPFPKDYQAKDLAGKMATFEVSINSVEESSEVIVDDEFAKKFGKNTIAELLSGIKEQMQTQLDDKLEQINKDAAFSQLLDNNELEVPKVSIAQEAGHLLEDMNNRMKQQGIPENDSKLDASVFNDEAARRVKLGLLVGDITAKNSIKETDEQVQAKLKIMAAQYGEQGEQMITYYNSNQTALDGIRSMVVEKLASDFIFTQAKVVEVEKKFSEVVGG